VLQSERGRRCNADPVLTTPLLGIATMAANALYLRYPSEYRSWCALRARCRNPNDNRYHRYGGRGITFCERWNSFAAFLEDMGPKPTPGLTIERRDNNGNYEPSNCCWMDRAEQSKNRSVCLRITAFDETLNVSDWARKIGMRRTTLTKRITEGMLPEQAMQLPVTTAHSRIVRLARLAGDNEALQKARENHPHRKSVVDPNGKFWASQRLAAEAHGISQSNISLWCRHSRHGWSFA
jgi:hypothetical protein